MKVQRVHVESGMSARPEIALAAMAAVDPYMRAEVEARSRAAVVAAERGMRRRALGTCECGLAPGEEHCPVCDGIMGDLGRRLREMGRTLTEITGAEQRLAEFVDRRGLPPRVLVAALSDCLAHVGNDVERAAARAVSDAQMGEMLRGMTPPETPPQNRHDHRRDRARQSAREVPKDKRPRR